MKPLITLWRFSRPHTIIGSVTSILTLYIIACNHQHVGDNLPLLLLAIITGICCNIFIVGINQIEDVKIDVINKPYLPIASGDLSLKNAYRIIITCMIISLSVSAYLSPYLFGIIALSLLIGMAYSLPPLYLKKHHFPAALAITTVRGVLVNIGGFMVFNWLINHSTELPSNIRILTLFIIAFSIAISWFKDLPDVAGDAKYDIRTFAILYSPKTALIAGNVLVISAYVYSIVMKAADYTTDASRESAVLLFGHIFLLVVFLVNTFSIKLSEHQSIKKFYMRFWIFFFAEYVVYLIAYV
jgi:homogentisate phytyltransferase/homogentisate geranylgeranyltransferase